MKRTLLAALLILCSLPLPAQKKHTFATQGDHFVLDGKPFKVLSGELHYERIPRAYWHARLKMAKAMGLNTIATYVFWNMHEPTPGHFDFTGNNDVAAFIRAAQEEGLYVILRTGPYSCAEWDLGGIPAWLLNTKARVPHPSQSHRDGWDEQSSDSSLPPLRSNDPAFMVPAERWIDRLAKEVAPLQIGRGGPILMTQVENEYGNFGSDHVYMEHLHQIFLHAGFTGSLLYTADNWRNIPNGSIPGLFAATNFGIGNHKGGMDALEKARPGAPLFVSEYWPGWFDSWGHPHETRPIGPQIEDIDYILKRGAGINIYMFHGGTSFGFMSGSSLIKGRFLPDVTSYDYDAPLDEAGHPTPKFFAYRKVLAQYAGCPTSGSSDVGSGSTNSTTGESCLPPIPAAPPVITIPKITLTQSTPLWANLPAPIRSELPQPMERFNQSYGYILYRTKLPAHTHGDLVIDQVHDYAQVYIDGKLIGTLDRRFADPKGDLPPVTIETNGPARLDILVAEDGRINSTRNMRGENKGITHSVTLASQPLANWQVYPLPMTFNKTPDTSSRPERSAVERPLYFHRSASTSQGTPTFFRATFTLSTIGDTFLDIRDLGKGALWVNGHAIGRFWNTGPQQTLYIPGPWLRKGRNQIVVFDMAPQSAHPHVAGLAQPILNGPVADQSISKQE